MRKKIYIIMPAYNEELKIAKVIDEVAQYADKIIVVDDGSTDKTVEKAKHPKSIVLRHSMNLGQGAALKTGFEYVKAQDADIIITYDADGQFEADDIPAIIKPILSGKADVVFGSRFLGKAVNISIFRRLILKLGIVFTYLLSNIHLTDTHNGLRAFSKSALRQIFLTHSRMAHASEIIDEVARCHLTYVEVPVTVKYNIYSQKKGQSSLNALNIVIDILMKKIS